MTSYVPGSQPRPEAEPKTSVHLLYSTTRVTVMGDSGVEKLEISCLTPSSNIAKFSFFRPVDDLTGLFVIDNGVDIDDIRFDLFDSGLDDGILFLFLSLLVFGFLF